MTVFFWFGMMAASSTLVIISAHRLQKNSHSLVKLQGKLIEAQKAEVESLRAQLRSEKIKSLSLFDKLIRQAAENRSNG